MAIIEEKKNGNGRMPMGSTCTCAGCAGGWGGHTHSWMFFLLRTLVTILILMVVFWFGVEVGRMGSGMDRYYMMRGGYTPGVYNSGSGGMMPMMPVNGATSSPSVTGYPQNY